MKNMIHVYYDTDLNVTKLLVQPIILAIKLYAVIFFYKQTQGISKLIIKT